MIKTYDQFSEIDPYGEENWDERKTYKVMKTKGFKNLYLTFLYHLIEMDSIGSHRVIMVRDFDTMLGTPTLLNLFELNEKDKEKLESGEDGLSNGWDLNKVSLEEMRQKIKIRL